MVHFTVDQNRLSDQRPASVLVKRSFSNMAWGRVVQANRGLEYTLKKVQMSCLVMAGSRPLSFTHPSSIGTAASLMLPYMRPARAGLVCTCPAMAGFRAATPEMLMVKGPVVYTPACHTHLTDCSLD